MGNTLFLFFFHSAAGHYLQQWVQRNKWNTGFTVIQFPVADIGVSLS
ncbi:phosphoethanolamine transferase CptA domain protein [Escherichia coli TW07509]|nr:phosphoethanolamine transferase CptA domain protein [Escherichia coli TW07509]